MARQKCGAALAHFSRGQDPGVKCGNDVTIDLSVCQFVFSLFEEGFVDKVQRCAPFEVVTFTITMLQFFSVKTMFNVQQSKCRPASTSIMLRKKVSHIQIYDPSFALKMSLHLPTCMLQHVTYFINGAAKLQQIKQCRPGKPLQFCLGLAQEDATPIKSQCLDTVGKFTRFLQTLVLKSL